MNQYRLTITVELPEEMAGEQEGEHAVYNLASTLESAALRWWDEANREDDSDLDIAEIKIEQRHVRWEELP